MEKRGRKTRGSLLWLKFPPTPTPRKWDSVIEIFQMALGGQLLPQPNGLRHGAALPTLTTAIQEEDVIHPADVRKAPPQLETRSRRGTSRKGAWQGHASPSSPQGLLSAEVLSPPGPQGSRAPGRDLWAAGQRNGELW